MSFVGSSELWGEDSTARLCQILLDANDGMAQQISENRHDLLDLLTLKDLERVDDCGLSLPYLAVHYDRPDMVRYLHKRGLDLSKPCDPMEFGTPMFYAVSTGKMHIVETLDSLGISVKAVCDTYMKKTPSFYASLTGDPSVALKIENLVYKEQLAGDMFMKNFLKSKYRRRFLRMKRAAILIQKCSRGLADRIMVRLVRAGAITLDTLSESSASRSRSSGARDRTVKEKKSKNKANKEKEKGKDKRRKSSLGVSVEEMGVEASGSMAESGLLEDSLGSLSLEESL